jgi:flagellar biosynthesis anti-sigma factor FlgM
VVDKADGGDNGKRPSATRRTADVDAKRDATPTQSGTSKNVDGNGNGEPKANMKNETSTTLTAEVTQLTANLRTLAALDEVIDGLPVIDITKVERIRFALETGAYRISPQRIADKMVDFERDWD